MLFKITLKILRKRLCLHKNKPILTEAQQEKLMQKLISNQTCSLTILKYSAIIQAEMPNSKLILMPMKLTKESKLHLQRA